MEFAKPQKFTANIIEKTNIAKNAILVKMEILGNDPFNFRAGQFLNVQVSPTAFRSYSIASLEDGNVLSLILTVGHDGLGSNFFKSVQVGTPVTIIGPSGKFVLPDNLKENLIFLATSSGIVPFIPMLKELADLKFRGKIDFYAGFRSEEDIFATDSIEKFSEKLNLTYTVCISEPSTNWYGEKGRITGKYKVSDPDNTQIFACGNPYMVKQVSNELESLGFDLDQFFHEKFLSNNAAERADADCSVRRSGAQEA